MARETARGTSAASGRARSARGARAHTVSADHHALGLITQSPLILVCLIIGLGIVIYGFTMIQIGNTEGSVLALLQAGTTVVPGQTAAQFQAMINGKLDQYQGIATTIGIGVQVALVLCSFPADAAMQAMHRRFGVEVSPSLMEAASKQDGWRMLLTRVLIGGDILTDFLAVIRGHTVFSGFGGIAGIIPQLDLGVLVVGIIYPAAICFITIFCLKYLFIFLENLLEKVTPGFLS